MRFLPMDHPLVRGKEIGDLVVLAEQDGGYSYNNVVFYRITWRRRDIYFLAVEDFRLKMCPLPVLIASSKLAAERCCTYHNPDDSCYLRDERCTDLACYRQADCAKVEENADLRLHRREPPHQ